MLLAPSSCPTGAQRLKQDGLSPWALASWRPRVSTATAPKPPVPPCRGNVAASWWGNSALPGTAHLPQVLPVRRVLCQQPAPNRVSVVPGAWGDAGEVRGGWEGDAPCRSTAGSSRDPCLATGLPRSIRRDLRSYGYKHAAAAACPPYATSLCSCLDSLITWRQRERGHHHPRLGLSSLAEPAWALNKPGDRDGDRDRDGFLYELPGSAPPWSRASSCRALRALGSPAPCPGCSWG